MWLNADEDSKIVLKALVFEFQGNGGMWKGVYLGTDI